MLFLHTTAIYTIERKSEWQFLYGLSPYKEALLGICWGGEGEKSIYLQIYVNQSVRTFIGIGTDICPERSSGSLSRNCPFLKLHQYPNGSLSWPPVGAGVRVARSRLFSWENDLFTLDMIYNSNSQF